MDKKKIAAILCGAALLICAVGIVFCYYPPAVFTRNHEETVRVVTQTDYVFLPTEKEDTSFKYENLQKITYRTLDGTVHTVSPWALYYVKDVSVVEEEMAMSPDVMSYLSSFGSGVFVLMPASSNYNDNDVIQFGPAGMTAFFQGPIVRREGYIALSAENRGTTVRINGYEAQNVRAGQAFTSKDAIAQAMSHVRIEVPLADVNIYYAK